MLEQSAIWERKREREIMAHHHNSRYAETYRASMSDREGFWLDVAKSIDWVKPPSRAFDESLGVYGRWFPDAVCNTCYNALDRHVAGGRANQPAMIYDSPVTGTKAILISIPSSSVEMSSTISRLPFVKRFDQNQRALSDSRRSRTLIFAGCLYQLGTSG